MKKLFGMLLPLAALALVAGGCDSTGTTVSKNGVWFGFVFDAKSGTALNFFPNVDETSGVDANDKDDNDSVNQIYVLDAGEVKTASPCKKGDANDDNGISLAGCFRFDGLPTAAELPVFTQYSGYHSFHSVISIDPFATGGGSFGGEGIDGSVTVNCADGSSDVFSGGGNISGNDSNTECNVDITANGGSATFDEPVFADTPIQYANVRMFPTGISYDYTVHATVGDRGFADVVVRCIFDDQDSFDIIDSPGDNNFLDPDNDFNPILTGTTDANGNVTFTGDQLTKGGDYDCFAHATLEIDGAVISYDGGTSFVVGVDDNFVDLELSSSGEGFFALWSNIDDSDNRVGLNGPVTIILNRNASLIGGSECVAADVSGPGDNQDPTAPDATTAVTVDGGGSEQATVDLTGDTLTLSPIWATAPTGNDRGYVWTFGGVFLSPASGSDTSDIYDINGGYSGLGGVTAAANTTGVETYTDCAGVNTAAGNTGGNLDNATTGGDQTDDATLN